MKCAGSPDVTCSCGRTGVCNHSNLGEWKKKWPEYNGLGYEVLRKLKKVVEIQLLEDNSYRDELSFLNYLIRTNANK